MSGEQRNRVGRDGRDLEEVIFKVATSRGSKISPEF